MKGAYMNTDLMLSYIDEITADVRHLTPEPYEFERKEAALTRLATLRLMVQEKVEPGTVGKRWARQMQKVI